MCVCVCVVGIEGREKGRKGGRRDDEGKRGRGKRNIRGGPGLGCTYVVTVIGCRVRLRDREGRYGRWGRWGR